MIALSPDQLNALKSVISDLANQVSSVLSIPTSEVEIFLEEVRYLVAGSRSLRSSSYLLVLDTIIPNPSELPKLREADVQKWLGVNRHIFIVNQWLNLKETIEGSIKITDCQTIMSNRMTFGILLQGTYAYFILNNKFIDQHDLLSNSSQEPWPSGLYHTIDEFNQLLDEHKENVIDREGIVIWANKVNRILKASPENTESIFHRSLFNWMYIFLRESLKVYAEPDGYGQCKTDITVVTHEGCTVIEIKWLGINEKNTKYGQDKINEGLIQIQIYLDKEDYVDGYLVLYDGRPRDQHEKESDYDRNLIHSKCRCPILVFLESETPSQTAQRIVRESRNDKSN